MELKVKFQPLSRMPSSELGATDDNDDDEDDDDDDDGDNGDDDDSSWPGTNLILFID